MSPEAAELFKFLRSRGCLRAWDDKALNDLVTWSLQAGKVARVRQKDGTLVGAAIAHRVNRRKATKHQNPYYHSEVGNALYVTAFTVMNRQVFPFLVRAMEKTFERPRFLIGRRHNKIKCWNLEKFTLTLGKIYG